MKIRISLSVATEEWWKTLTREQQDAYLKEHPRSKYGKAHKSAPKNVKVKPVVKKKEAPSLTVADSNRAGWPDHIKRLTIPPAWTNVQYSEDPGSALQATGHDAKGRKQFVYSEEFSKSQSALKFQRVLELDKKFNAIAKENKEALLGDDPKKKDHAECLNLIMMMGLRPGGEKDTKAEKQAYGATTLEGRHVVEEDGKTFLRFVGKKGVSLNLEVEDKELAASLKARAAKAGTDGQMFQDVQADTLSDYTHTLDGGGFKTKDFRTALATRSANKLVRKYTPKPTNASEYKKAVKEVAVAVSKKLGNTPIVAMQSYIAPQIFSEWRPIEGLET